MAKHEEWIWYAAGAALVAYLISQQTGAAAGATAKGTPFYSTQPTPYSVYPEWAYTAQTQGTSMAASPNQMAPTAVMPKPTTYFTSVQQQEQAALMSQCMGAWPGCTPMLGDTQLGF
jgi:hypothetical protein